MTERITYEVDGASISALVSGRKGNPVALFLHGIPASAKLWDGILPGVSRNGWYCIAPDCPGYGETTVENTAHYNLQGTADLFLKLIKKEHFSEVWLIAHDIGGAIAQLMLTKEPSLFLKATLSNCATARTWPVPVVKLTVFAARLGLYPLLAKFGLVNFMGIRDIRRGFYHKERLTTETLSRVFFDNKVTSKKGRYKFAQMLKQLSASFTADNMEKLSKVSTPVYLVWAMDDPHQRWSDSGVILERTIKNTSVTHLQQASHFLQLDIPERYVEAILE